MQAFFGQAVGRIYDCVVEPSAWQETLGFIRDGLNCAFVGINAVDFPDIGAPRPFIVKSTPWDSLWVDRLLEILPTIPGFDDMRAGDLDQPMVFRRIVGAQAFRASTFYRDWVRPQGLADACNTPVLQRAEMTAMLSAWTARGRRALGPADTAMLAALAPHLRRAILISDLLDHERQYRSVFAAVLDGLSVPVLLVGADGRLSWHNSAAERRLSTGEPLRLSGGRLHPASPAAATEFRAALARAVSVDEADIGGWGCGLPLPMSGGQRAVAYVLPFGRSERRHALGPGLAAVMLVEPGGHAPPPVEVLGAVLGLTAAEARVALALASGQGTAEAARTLGISANTLRKHLSNIFDKTGLRDRAALVADVNRFRAPIDPAPNTSSG